MKIVIGGMIALLLAACGANATPVVRFTIAGVPGMTLYVSGMSDANTRQQFEKFERSQGASVSEVSQAPKQTAAD